MIAGIIIIIIGLIYLLNTLNIGIDIDFDIVWPLILIVLSIYYGIKNRKIEISNIILLFIGAWFLLENSHMMSNAIEELFWPILLILTGISIIVYKINFNKKIASKVEHDGRLNYSGIFGGIEETVRNNNFKGAVVNAIFGGVELDLSEVVVTEKEIVIETTSIFGGIDLKMPKGYNIIVNSFVIFGGNENKYNELYDDKKNTIHINCISIFGGTEIK